MRQITIHVKKRKLRALKMMVLGIFMIVLVMTIDHRVRPLVETMSAYQAQLIATRNINEAVMEVISEEDVVYNTIVSQTYTPDGQVSSISTDMITVNRLKAEISNRISDYLERETTQRVQIPIGTLVGGQIFSGRGPKVEFRVQPVGYVHTEIYNEFLSAGINQTLHRLMLSVKVTMTAVVPLYTVTTDVNTNLSIAETMIVGNVPSAYTDINGDMSDLLDQLNNYEANMPETPQTP